MATSKKFGVLALAPFLLAGVRYEPGPVEVPADAIEKLKEKKLIEVPEGAIGGASQSAAVPEDQSTLDALRRERDEARAEVERLQSTLDTQTAPNLSALRPLGADVLAELIVAELDTPDRIGTATNEELDAINGIGPATVAKIRELLKG